MVGAEGLGYEPSSRPHAQLVRPVRRALSQLSRTKRVLNDNLRAWGKAFKIYANTKLPLSNMSLLRVVGRGKKNLFNLAPIPPAGLWAWGIMQRHHLLESVQAESARLMRAIEIQLIGGEATEACGAMPAHGEIHPAPGTAAPLCPSGLLWLDGHCPARGSLELKPNLGAGIAPIHIGHAATDAAVLHPHPVPEREVFLKVE